MTQTTCLWGVAAVTVFSILIGGSSCDEDSAASMQKAMYDVLHNLALPNFDKGHQQLITERFILMLPGEVLNYYDYCPLSKLGDEFDPYDYDSLPPDENAFRLSDTVTTLNPLGGGTTGKSLSKIYEDILYTIDTSTSKSNPFSQKSYNLAITYLSELVTDPENKSAPNVSRYELYYRYQKAYYDIKLQVREWFDGNKTNRSYEAYRAWYKENYESLMGYVSSTYIRWLVSGLKGPIEDRISLIDVKSEREIVEEARQAMRFEALPSLDGGSNYYPVHFIPSDWYKYLTSENKPTLDQIQAKIGNLAARRNEIQDMIELNITTSEEYNKKANEAVAAEQKKLNDIAKKYICYQYLCQAKEITKNPSTSPTKPKSCPADVTSSKADPCSESNKLQTTLDEQIEALAQVQLTGNSSISLMNTYTKKNLNMIIEQLNYVIANLQQQLVETQPPASDIINKAKINGTGQLSPEERSENWMLFSFDSETASQSNTSSNVQTTIDVSAQLKFFWWFNFGAQGSYSKTKTAQIDSHQSSSVDVSVTAKLLRVTMERNWFRPSLFSVGTSLKMEGGISPVSPGPEDDESIYITKAATGSYQLPEYTTGFLLAKDISMSFRGFDSNTVSTIVHSSTKGDLSLNVGPFYFGTNTKAGRNKDTSNLRVSIQSHGLKIDIPGAQIIGYYTSVLPTFPAL